MAKPAGLHGPPTPYIRLIAQQVAHPYDHDAAWALMDSVRGGGALHMRRGSVGWGRGGKDRERETHREKVTTPSPWV